MNTNSIIATVAFTTTLLAGGAFAQSTEPTTKPAASPAAPAAAAMAPASPMPTPNSIIYIPRLPTPAELSSAASAQGLAIAKMEVTGDHITVVYQNANGQTNTVSYQLLSSAGMAAAPAATAAAPTAVVPATTTVVYGQPGYYYDPFYYGWGWPWYGPVAVSLGFSYHYGHFYGGHWGGHGGGHFGGPGFHHR